MIKFSTFVNEGAYKLTDAERDQVNEITDRYFIYFSESRLTGLLGRQKDPKKLYKKELNAGGEFFLGSIDYIDLQTNTEKTVYVDVSFEDVRARADYLESEKKITLYYYTLGSHSKSLIRSTILHELLHAKQQYKKKGSEYRYATQRRTLPSGHPSLRSKRGYYLHPTEFPVHMTVISDEIQQSYLDITARIDRAREEGSEGEMKMWTRKKNNLFTFLRSFIKSGGNLSQDVPLPPFLEDQKEFITTLFKNRNTSKYGDAFKKFYKTIYNTLEQLESYENR